MSYLGSAGEGEYSHNHDSRYYTEAEDTVLYASKSPISHNHTGVYAPEAHDHDGRYYTEGEVTTLLSGKSDNHSHPYLGSTANAASATKLATARTISLGGDCSGSTTFDGTVNKSITVVVNNDSHTHDGRYFREDETYSRGSMDSRYAYKGGVSGQSFTMDRLNCWEDAYVERHVYAGMRAGDTNHSGNLYCQASNWNGKFGAYALTTQSTSRSIHVVSANDTIMNLRSTGRLYIEENLYEGGADYAEFFEWEDGNPSIEDRIGRSVVMVGDQIREAVESDDPSIIIGAISGTPGVIGNSAPFVWQGKIESDVWGRCIYEDTPVWEWDGPDGEKEHAKVEDVDNGAYKPDDAIETTLATRKISDDYTEQEYIPREERHEWDTVGLVGKVKILKGQFTGDRWIKLQDITDTIEEWLIR